MHSSVESLGELKCRGEAARAAQRRRRWRRAIVLDRVERGCACILCKPQLKLSQRGALRRAHGRVREVERVALRCAEVQTVRQLVQPGESPSAVVLLELSCFAFRRMASRSRGGGSGEAFDAAA